MRRLLTWLAALLLLVVCTFYLATRLNVNPTRSVGEVIDTFNGVHVFYNGGVGHVSERVLSPDGYNIGLKYQCVEFVKRYYYERFGHKMPMDRGHAKDFYNPSIKNGELSLERGLLQFSNGMGDVPKVEDLVVFSPWLLNRYGHVAIVSAVGADFVEVIQQNPGPFGSSRERYAIIFDTGTARIDHPRLLGWLRRPPPPELARLG